MNSIFSLASIKKAFLEYLSENGTRIEDKERDQKLWLAFKQVLLDESKPKDKK